MSCFASLALLLAASNVPAVHKIQSEGARAAFEAAATGLSEISYVDVLCGRIVEPAAIFAPPEDARLQAALLERDDPLDEVLALLAHEDPRVRGLALLELFDRGEPALLPHLVALKDEASEAVPMSGFPSAVHTTEPTPAEPITVGRVARMLLLLYLNAAGYQGSLEGARGESDWAAYWEPRKDRAWCATWFAVQQLRSYGGGSPLREVPEALLQVRARVEALPSPDRELLLLWLPDVEGAFTTKAERLAAAKRLGREQLMAVLSRNPPTDDPDLSELLPTGGTYPLERVAQFVLENAGELLDASDVPALLAREAWELGTGSLENAGLMRTALWRVAAAQLEPARAREHLESALKTYTDGFVPEDSYDRLRVLSAAWRVNGEADDAWVAERFWAETRRRKATSSAPIAFIGELVRADPTDARRKLAVLVRHPGFESCNGELLIRIARQVDAWMEPDLFGEPTLSRAGHPLTFDLLSTDEGLARMNAQYPAETKACLDLFAAWRARLHESLPQWESGG
jgi:hypothetical protein